MNKLWVLGARLGIERNSRMRRSDLQKRTQVVFPIRLCISYSIYSRKTSTQCFSYENTLDNDYSGKNNSEAPDIFPYSIHIFMQISTGPYQTSHDFRFECLLYFRFRFQENTSLDMFQVFITLSIFSTVIRFVAVAVLIVIIRVVAVRTLCRRLHKLIRAAFQQQLRFRRRLQNFRWRIFQVTVHWHLENHRHIYNIFYRTDS